MNQIETELYIPQQIDDETINGIRLFTSNDDIYEIRESENSSSRLYADSGSWHGKIRFAEDDVEDAYDRFSAVAERLDEAYSVDLNLTVKAFHDQLKDEDHVEVQQGPIKLLYQEDNHNEMEFPIDRQDRILASLANTVAQITVGGGMFGGAGAGAGAVIGTVASLFDPTLLSAVTTGILYGGGLFGYAGAAGGLMASIDDDSEKFRKECAKKINRWRKGDYEDRDIASEQQHLIAKFNKRNRLGAYLEEADTYDTDVVEQYDELKEQDIDEDLDTVFDLLFREFDDLRGVMATIEADSYQEASSYLAAARDESEAVTDRPSLYKNREAFSELFEQFVYQEDGEKKMLTDGERLITNVLIRDNAANNTVEAYLEEQHPDLLAEAGNTLWR